MLLPEFQNGLGREFKIRFYEEHAYRTTMYYAKHKLLVIQMRNKKYFMELVDNASNSWHTIDEFEFSTEEELINALRDFLTANCKVNRS